MLQIQIGCYEAALVVVVIGGGIYFLGFFGWILRWSIMRLNPLSLPLSFPPPRKKPPATFVSLTPITFSFFQP